MLGKKYCTTFFFLLGQQERVFKIILKMDLNIMWSELPLCSLSVIKVAVVYTY